MPKAEIAARGGAVRVRTIRLPDDRYRRIYVVRDPGPRGGHTVAGEIHHRRDGASTKVQDDTQPQYKMKPKRPIPERLNRAKKR